MNIRIQLTQRQAGPGTLRGNQFHSSVTGEKPPSLQGAGSPLCSLPLPPRESALLNNNPTVWTGWETVSESRELHPPTNPDMHKSSAFHRRKRRRWLRASLIILKRLFLKGGQGETYKDAA